MTPSATAVIGASITVVSSQDACAVLARCDTRTLYVRNVPDDLVERLERLAAREGLSVSAFVAPALAIVTRRADNPALLADLPDLGVDADAVVHDLETGRSSR